MSRIYPGQPILETKPLNLNSQLKLPVVERAEKEFSPSY